jgi:hypothetical protein
MRRGKRHWMLAAFLIAGTRFAAGGTETPLRSLVETPECPDGLQRGGDSRWPCGPTRVSRRGAWQRSKENLPAPLDR